MVLEVFSNVNDSVIQTYQYPETREMESLEMPQIKIGPGQNLLVQARKGLPEPRLPGAPLFQHIFTWAYIQNKPLKSQIPDIKDE